MSDLERFLQGLRRREEAYRRMAGMVRQQAGALAGGDADALLALAARKGALLREIEAVERDLAPLRGRWPEWKRMLDPAVLREVEETVDRTRRVLGELVRMEEEGRAFLPPGGGGTAGPVSPGKIAEAYGPRERREGP